MGGENKQNCLSFFERGCYSSRGGTSNVQEGAFSSRGGPSATEGGYSSRGGPSETECAFFQVVVRHKRFLLENLV